MKDKISRYSGFAGLLLLALGSTLYAMKRPEENLILVLLIAGGGFVAATALLNIRTLAAFTRKRSARHGANAVLVTILFTAILVIIQAVSIRHTGRYDLTRNKRFTLAEQTVNLLNRLGDDVKITGFYRKNTDQWFQAMELLSRYEHQSDHVRYELVDPDQRPHVAEVMRARHGDVVVEHDKNRRVVRNFTEETLTNAVVLVTRVEQKTIYFVTGHDEKSLHDRDRTGYSEVKRGLEDEGYLVSDLSLLGVDRLPSDCEVLIIAGPKKKYLESEADVIAAYLDGGGDALFLLDPRRAVPYIEAILGGYGVAMDNIALLDELVIVEAGEPIFDATVTKIRRYERHPITEDFRAITLFPMARPVRIVPGDRDATVTAQYLAVTEKSAWGETDLDGFRAGRATRDTSDVQGPLPVALAAEKTIAPGDSTAPAPPGAAGSVSKIVVFGDSDFITNSFYGVFGNRDFFLNAVNFLAEDEDLISIRPKRGLGDEIFITASQGRLIFFLCLLLLPLSVASMGTYVFLKKRKA